MNNLRQDLSDKLNEDLEFKRALIDFAVGIDDRLNELAQKIDHINASLKTATELSSMSLNAIKNIPVLIQAMEEITKSQIGICNATSATLTVTQRNISSFEIAGVQTSGRNALTIGKKK